LCRNSGGYLRQARSVLPSGLSGHLVCLVGLVNRVGLVQPSKRGRPNRPDRPDRPERRDRPDRPNEQARLARRGRVRGSKFEVFGTSRLTLVSRFTPHVSRFLFSILIVVLIVGINSMAHGQYVGSCGTPSPLAPTSRTGSFEVVPSMCVSERYDSNIYYAHPTPGLDPKDFVTTVNPALRVNHNGDYASGFLNVGGFSETYAKNPGLNYFGTNGTLSLDLDNSIKRWLPNASLSVIDTVRYTPLPPGFVNPAAGTSPSDPANIQNIYAQGFLAFRTNNLTNNGTVSTSYATTASTSLNASYSHAIIRFGSSPSTQGVSLFNTTAQTGTVGGTARLSELDTLNVKYAHVQAESTPTSPSSGTTSSSFIIVNSATFNWSRTLTPNLSAALGGGGILIDPGQTTTYAANAALIMNFLNNIATISYAHSAFPSFYGGAGVRIGDTFSLSAIQMIDRQWQLAESAGYAHSSNADGASNTFDSFSAGGDIQYWMTSIWSTSLGYSYLKFNQYGSSTTDYDRQVITLSVRATWG